MIEDTRKFEAQLAAQYKYRKLKPSLSSVVRNKYRENIPYFLKEEGDNRDLYTKNGTQICSGYDRIVVGDYGAFVEFSEIQRARDFVCEKGQEYRLESRYGNAKYLWLTVKDGSNIKIYHQRETVDYADYIPGKYYVSVHEVDGPIREIVEQERVMDSEAFER